MKAHLRAVGVIDLITGILFAGLGLLVSARVLLFALWINGPAFWEQKDAVVASTILLFVSGVFFAFGVPSLIAGVGLLKQKRWAHTLAIVLAVLALVIFPIGTAAGIYTLWVLAQKETEGLLGTAS
ncbi:MAG TPA: hypothetical protein VLY63_19560 [Anaerolineae bacterium]|nr:hypothetical protein [Anaerolineae bacterium]